MKKYILNTSFSFLLITFLGVTSTPYSQNKLNVKHEYVLEILKRNNLNNSTTPFLKDRLKNTFAAGFNKQNYESNVLVDSVTGKDLLGNKFKAIYMYNSMGKIISDLRQQWDGTKLVNNTRTTSAFNPNGKRTMRLFENWDGSSWVGFNRVTYTYDSNGNETEELAENWNGSIWIKSSRWTTVYNSQGEPVSEINENWDGTNWVKVSRETVSYESNGDIIVIEEDWNGTAWVNVSRSTSAFNNGSLLTQTYETWNGTNWVNADRTSLTYDSNGRTTSLLVEQWNGSSWVNFWRYTYSFNTDGFRTSSLQENWDGSQWVAQNRTTNAYDSNGNNTEVLNENWDGSNWVKLSRLTYTYNSDGNVTAGLSEIWNNSSWIEGPGFLGFSIEGSSGFMFYSYFANQINVFYRSVTSVTENSEVISGFKLSQNYPNPFNPSTTIRYTIPAVETQHAASVQLKVYDILGNEIATLVNKEQSPGNYKVTFDGSSPANGTSLSSGVYFYRIMIHSNKTKNAAFIQTKKMILTK